MNSTPVDQPVLNWGWQDAPQQSPSQAEFGPLRTVRVWCSNLGCTLAQMAPAEKFHDNSVQLELL